MTLHDDTPSPAEPQATSNPPDGDEPGVESHARFEQFFDLCREMLCFAGLDGYFKRVNPAFERNLGYTAKELLQRPFLDLVHPEDREATLAELASLGGGHDTTQFENRYRCASGDYIWLEWSARPISNNEIYGVARNTTERRIALQALRESEQRFRELAENIREVFYITSGEDGQVQYVSPAFEEIWGLGVDELYRDSELWLRHISSFDRDRVMDRWRSIEATSEFDVEYSIVRADGSVRYIWDRAFVVLNDAGKVQRIVGIAEDITFRRQAEDRARQRESELAHVARLTTLGEMASGIAHELNQPLSAISIQTESCRLAASVNKIDRVLEDLKAISGQTQRAGQVLRRLRHFVRRHEPITTEIDLNEIVSDVVQFVQFEANANSIEMCVRQGSVPIVSGDPVQLQQVVLNLVQNAIQAVVDQPKPLIVLETQSDESPTILVRDNGPGIPSKILRRVFEPFFSTKAEGIGIGLAISRSIVEAHHGRLFATSEPGRTEFKLMLPPRERGSSD